MSTGIKWNNTEKISVTQTQDESKLSQTQIENILLLL